MTIAQARHRVLVVEDERIIADTLAEILLRQGFDARAVYSGEQAVELVSTWPPDAVISDVVMGPMDGVSLAIYLAKVLPKCKVLLITAQLNTDPLLATSRELGHDFPIMSKPVPPATLFEFLEPLRLSGDSFPEQA